MQKKVSKNNSKKLKKQENPQRDVLDSKLECTKMFPNEVSFWSIRSRRMTKVLPPSTALSKDEELRDIGQSMSIRNLLLGVSSVTVSYLIHYDSLLQNATDIITKCDSYFITKCDRSLLQNASGFSLQIATISLQNATVITKCYVYYKLRQYAT